MMLVRRARGSLLVLGAAATAFAACSGAGSGGAGGSASAGATGTGGATGAGGTFMGLHAVPGSNGRAGTIVDKNGATVVLHGADESGTENYCTTWGPPPIVISPEGGPSPLTQDSLTAMKSWGLNTVRIPLNEDCWLGINGVDASVGGANYQTPIQTAVDLITQTNGMYVILDLHWSAPGTMLPTAQGTMPDLDHTVTFWQEVAAAYKNNGSVVFDLFNEPVMSGSDDQQYKCWKNGSTTAGGGDCATVSFPVAGMQQLVTAVRQAGANNLIMLGGIGYASELDLWPTYVPTDTLSPPNIAASWHVYDDQGGCTSDGPTTVATLCDSSNGRGAEAVMNAGYPIVVGETGYYSCSASVGEAWWPLFLSWADAQGLGFVAWSWSDGNNPQLLANTTTFDPGGIGPTYQQYLQCIAGKTVTPATSCTFVPSTGCE
jgi:Cellulase (glycosyl hydrolase family 5)